MYLNWKMLSIFFQLTWVPSPNFIITNLCPRYPPDWCVDLVFFHGGNFDLTLIRQPPLYNSQFSPLPKVALYKTVYPNIAILWHFVSFILAFLDSCMPSFHWPLSSGMLFQRKLKPLQVMIDSRQNLLYLYFLFTTWQADHAKNGVGSIWR